jgi:hypothetical protein
LEVIMSAVKRRSRHLRAAGALAVAASAVASLAVVGASPAQATPQRLCAVVDVPESSSLTHVRTLRPYERLTVTPGGSIWAGVWFTGENGPGGWSSTAPPGWGYPRPGAPQYSLLGGLSGETWRYVGANTYTFYNNSPSYRSLWARVNDNVPGNGSGAFTMQFCYYTS